VPARWVTADAFYGRSHELRQWLEAQGRAYALMIPKTNAVWYQGRRELAEQVGERLCAAALSEPWVCLELSEACAAGMRRWLLVRCDAEDPDEHRYFLACGPEGTGVEELVRVCQARWQIEESLAEAKGEVGLDQYEVRKWNAWHRHVTLCLLAHAYLVVMRRAARAEETEEKGVPTPVSSR
jgi:SRSO17 transposase